MDDELIILDSSPENSASEWTSSHQFHTRGASKYTPSANIRLLDDKDVEIHEVDSDSDVDADNAPAGAPGGGAAGSGNNAGGIGGNAGGAGNGQNGNGGAGSHGNGHGGSGGGANGGENGGNGGEGNAEDSDEDAEENEEEHEDEDVAAAGGAVITNSGSSSGGSSIPPLVRPPACDIDPNLVLRSYSEVRGQSQGQALLTTSTAAENISVSSESTGAGGLSDAQTAILGGSDLEGQGSEVRQDVMHSSPQPGFSGGAGVGPSSVLNVTVSSLTSSSSSGQEPQPQPPRSGKKRAGQTKSGSESSAKKAKRELSTSTSDTSGRDTSATTTTTTTSRTTASLASDTSHEDHGAATHDTSGDVSHGDVTHHDISRDDHRDDESRGGGQNLTGTESRDESPAVTRDEICARDVVMHRVLSDGRRSDAASDFMLFARDVQSQNKVSMSLSQSSDIELSLSCVPPSQNEGPPRIPRILPSSPTDLVGSSSCSQMALHMSPSQYTEYSCGEISTGANRSTYRPYLAGSQSDSINFTDGISSQMWRSTAIDDKCEPGLQLENGVNDSILSAARTDIDTFQWEWQKPVCITSDSFNSSLEGSNAVFKKTPASCSSKPTNDCLPHRDVMVLDSLDCSGPVPDKTSNDEHHTTLNTEQRSAVKSSKSQKNNSNVKKSLKDGDRVQKTRTKKLICEGVKHSRQKAQTTPRTVQSPAGVINAAQSNAPAQSSITAAMDSLVEDSQGSFTNLKQSDGRGTSSKHSSVADGSTVLITGRQPAETADKTLYLSADDGKRAPTNNASIQNTSVDTVEMVAINANNIALSSLKKVVHHVTPSCVTSSTTTQRRSLFMPSQRRRSSMTNSRLRPRTSDVGLNAALATDATAFPNGKTSQSGQITSVTASQSAECCVYVTSVQKTHLLRTIKHVHEYVNGKLIKTTISEKTEKLSEEYDQFQEVLTPLSEQRSHHSLSSADLADISSLSRDSSTRLLRQNSRNSPTPNGIATCDTSHPPHSVQIANPVAMVTTVITPQLTSLSTPVMDCADPQRVESDQAYHTVGSHRTSDVLFSSYESKSDSSGRRQRSTVGIPASYRNRSSIGLFTTDVGADAGNFHPDAAIDRASAIARCDTIPLDDRRPSPDDQIFRLPFPKRSSTSSSASRRSSTGLVAATVSLCRAGSSVVADGDQQADGTGGGGGGPSPRPQQPAGGTVRDDLVGLPVNDSGSVLLLDAATETRNKADNIVGRHSDNNSPVKSGPTTTTTAAATTTTPAAAPTPLPAAAAMTAGSVANSPSAANISQRGELVLAQWQSDKLFYPAVILSATTHKVHVEYGDGNTATVYRSKLVHCSLIPVRMAILAKREETGCYEPAVIQSYSYSERDIVDGYNVLFVLDETPVETRIDKMNISLTYTHMESLQDWMKSGGNVSGKLSPEKALRSVAKDIDNNNVLKETVSAGSSSAKLFDVVELKSSSVEGMEVETDKDTEAVDVEYEPRFVPHVAEELQNLEPSQEVFAMWKDKFYYPGRVKVRSSTDNHQWLIHYDDGNEMEVASSSLIVCDLLPTLTEVLARRPTAAMGPLWSELATIVGHWKSDSGTGYIVQFVADRFSCRVNREFVFLASNQATTLLKSLEGVRLKDPSFTVCNISADNVVEGKRKKIPLTPGGLPGAFVDHTPGGRRTKSACKTPSRSSGTPRRRQRSRTKHEQSTNTSGVINTNTLGVITGSLTESSDTNSPVTKRRQLFDVNDAAHELPQSSKQSTGKSASVSSSSSSSSELFKGCVFLVTFNKNSELAALNQSTVGTPAAFNQSTVGTPGGADNTALSPSDEILFDREEVCDMIHEHGGVVLETFDLETVQNAELCLLISDGFKRTRKYFCALAANVPCISHVWVHHCCQNGLMLDHRKYELPTGLCLETNQVVESGTGNRPLSNLVIVLESKDHFDGWLQILEAAGCYVLARLPPRSLRRQNVDEKRVDVVVADRCINPSTLSQAHHQQIPVVSVEWVIQCLITGRRLSYTGHVKYSADNL